MGLKDKTKVTYHAGILTIGGTIIEVSYGDSHIFFDFGTEYNPDVKKPDEKLQTLVNFREVPELKNIYDPRLDYEYDGDETATYQNTAVFLSHVHLDHTKMINYLDPKIPLYTTKATNQILRVLNKDGKFLIPNPFEKPNYTRDITEVAPDETIRVGEIEVTLVAVDHDAYGACGLIIKTPTVQIAYTGDLRLHGTNPEDTMNYCLQAHGSDLVIMEGVSISFDEPTETVPNPAIAESEQDLIHKINSIISENPNRVPIFNTYPGNIQRVINICENVHKKVVLRAEIAELVKKVTGKDELYYYRPGEKSINILDPKMEVSYNRLWEEPLSYFVQVDQDYEKYPKNAIYIHSDAEPFDFAPDFQPFLEKLAADQVEFVPLSCSGHANPRDLDKIVAAIKPKLLTPIHSWHPERLNNPFGERKLVQRGETIYF